MARDGRSQGLDHTRRAGIPDLCASVAASLALLIGSAAGTAAQESANTSRFETLRRTIDDLHVRSIEALLPLLSPAMRSRYVLVFNSRSLQQASALYPRVLLFGSDARFIVSFNGDAGEQGFDTLETMEFDDASASFTFREVRFRGDGVEISQPNAARCTACHGNPAHPIWDTYPLWPGAYGERYLKSLSEPESEGLAEFSRVQGTHPRYRNLSGFDSEQLRERIAPSHRQQYSGVLDEPPNAVLSGLLGRLEVSAIEREVTESPSFSGFRYALLWSLHPECGGVVDAIPADVLASHVRDYASFVRLRQKDARQRAAAKSRRTASGAQDPSFAPQDAALDGFRYLAEQGLGLSTRHWTLDMEQGIDDLRMQEPVESQLEDRLLAVAARADPGLADLRQAAGMSSDVKYCGRLRRLSLDALSRR